MSAVVEWDQATPNGVAYKALPMLIGHMLVKHGRLCAARRVDAWGHEHVCVRDPEHTGRHLAGERILRYPTAVWR